MHLATTLRKSRLLFFSVILTLGGSYLLSGQAKSSLQDLPYDIFEALSSNKPGEGKIIIRQPRTVRAQVGKVSRHASPGVDSYETIRLRQGFRIQAYNGNLATSKQEAYHRAELVSKELKSAMCYITYKAPFWRLLVGDYESVEDAKVALDALKLAVPSIASELYIVRDKIRSTE